MLNNTQEDELIRLAAMRHSVEPDVISQMLALAPNFENMNLYGMKVEFTRSVERILDGAISPNGNGVEE